MLSASFATFEMTLHVYVLEVYYGCNELESLLNLKDTCKRITMK